MAGDRATPIGRIDERTPQNVQQQVAVLMYNDCFQPPPGSGKAATSQNEQQCIAVKLEGTRDNYTRDFNLPGGSQREQWTNGRRVATSGRDGNYTFSHNHDYQKDVHEGTLNFNDGTVAQNKTVSDGKGGTITTTHQSGGGLDMNTVSHWSKTADGHNYEVSFDYSDSKGNRSHREQLPNGMIHATWDTKEAGHVERTYPPAPSSLDTAAYEAWKNDPRTQFSPVTGQQLRNGNHAG